MSSIKENDFKSALERKGFKLENTDHHRYRLYDENGKKTQITTKISHGHSKSHREIGDSLINSMKKQLHLNKTQFLDYVKCTLSKEEYYEILRSQDLI